MDTKPVFKTRQLPFLLVLDILLNLIFLQTLIAVNYSKMIINEDRDEGYFQCKGNREN